MSKSDFRRSRALSYAAALLVVGVSVVAMECGRPDNSAPVPRRTAYHRIQRYDSAYTRVDSFPIDLWINSGTSLVRSNDGKGTLWLDVAYPRYEAVLRLTYTPVDRITLPQVLDNRNERTAMNIGEHHAEITRLASQSGVGSVIVKAPGAVVTPLQWVATDSSTFVLSAVMEINVASDIATEEAVPVVEAVYDDIIEAARRLSRNG